MFISVNHSFSCKQLIYASFSHYSLSISYISYNPSDFYHPFKITIAGFFPGFQTTAIKIYEIRIGFAVAHTIIS